MFTRIIVSGISASFCLVTGLSVYLKDRKSKLNLYFFLFNFSAFFWNSSDFLGPMLLATKEGMTIYYRLSYLGGILLIPLFFHLTTLIIDKKISVVERAVFGLIVTVASGLILILPTQLLIKSVGFDVTFQEIPGSLFGVFSSYFMLGFIYNLGRLIIAFNREKDRDKKIRLKYFCYALAFAVICAIVAFLGISFHNSSFAWSVFYLFEVVYIGVTSYAILKKKIMDPNVILGKGLSYVLVGALIAFSFLLMNVYTQASVSVNRFSIFLLMLFWAFFGSKIHEWVVATARHTFVKGYYNPDHLFTKISVHIKDETDRASVFETVKKDLDKGINFEQIWTIIAVRDQNKMVNEYVVTDYSGKKVRAISADNLVVQTFSMKSDIRKFESFAENEKHILSQLGFHKKCLFMPVSSPELLEGIIVLGERSSFNPIEKKDLDFLKIIMNHVTAKLFTLTPQEIIESKYMQNKRKEHDEELQLIRSRQNRSIAHATGQCAHELRTPINVIKQNAWLYKSGDVPKEEFLTTVEREVERANFIVNETLAIAEGHALEEGVKQSIDINLTIHRCFKLVPNRITLIQDLSDVPAIEGNFEDLQILFTNLMANAIQAIKETGEIKIVSKFSCDEVVVEFSDTGVGIPKDEQVRVWEPYVSGSSTSEAGGNITAGKGWGLSIVNRIVNEHNGTVSLASEVGKGTTFTLRFPAAPK